MSKLDHDQDKLQIRQKRILFRAQHRGIREMDILFGDYLKNRLENFTEDQLSAIEEIIQIPDQILFNHLLDDQQSPHADIPIELDLASSVKMLSELKDWVAQKKNLK